MIQAEEDAKAKAAALEALEKQKAEQAKIAALKKKNTVNGTGTDPVVVSEPLDWSSSDFDGIPTLTGALETTKNDINKGSTGIQVLADSDSIEDSKIRIYRVKNNNGEWQTRVRFKLTDWAGRDRAKELIAAQLVPASDRLKFRKFVKSEDGSIQTSGFWENYYIDKDSKGTTYSSKVVGDDGALLAAIEFHRAVKDDSTPDYTANKDSGKNQAISYNNEVDIYLPDDATPEQIELALKAAGVKQARPATKEDIRVLAENKIISLFGNKADGSKNFSGELRQKVLNDVKEKYGLDAADVTVELINGSDIVYLMPQEVADQIVGETNATYFNHTLKDPKTKGKTRARHIFNMITKNYLMPTVDRWASGINIEGQSSKQDGYSVGANYVFLAKDGYAGRHFSFDGSKLLRRLDYYANNYDGWGKKQDGEINTIDTISPSSVTEVLFKGTISWADLAYINVDSATRDYLIEMLLKAEIKDIGGKPIQDVIRAK